MNSLLKVLPIYINFYGLFLHAGDAYVETDSQVKQEYKKPVFSASEVLEPSFRPALQVGSKKTKKKTKNLRALAKAGAPSICPVIDEKLIRGCDDNYHYADAAEECVYRLRETAIIASNVLENSIKQRSWRLKKSDEVEEKQSKLFDTSTDDYKKTEQVILRMREIGKAALVQMIRYKLAIEDNSGEDAETGANDGACYLENKKTIESKLIEAKNMVASTNDPEKFAKAFKNITDSNSTNLQENAAKGMIKILGADGNVIAEGDSTDGIFFKDADTAKDYKSQTIEQPSFSPKSAPFAE